MGLLERKNVTEFYHNLVFAKIAGRISQAELDRRLKEQTAEQLSLGIGASTEVRKK